MFGQAGPCDVGHHVPGILGARPVHFLQMTGVSQAQSGAGTLFTWSGEPTKQSMISQLG